MERLSLVAAYFYNDIRGDTWEVNPLTKIAKLRKLPLYVSISDDYVFISDGFSPFHYVERETITDDMETIKYICSAGVELSIPADLIRHLFTL